MWRIWFREKCCTACSRATAISRAAPTGAGLTPDERELWISDQGGKRLYIFDATQMPPKETGHVDLTEEGHGWITFDIAGRYAYCHTPDVIDVKTRKILATLKDDQGQAGEQLKIL
jgi:hypothetical protein